MAAKPEAEPRDPTIAKFLYELLLSHKTNGMTQRAMAEKTAVSTATISNIINGKGSYGVGREVAAQLGQPFGLASYDAVLDAAYSARLGRLRQGVDDALEKHAVYMPARSFLLKLRRLPGLERWVEDHPKSITVWELARGIAAYESSPPRSDQDGVPFGGWAAFFDDVNANRLSGPKKSGDQSAAEALEKSQLPAGTRRRLKR